jgi:hypothetical protein
MEKYTDKKDVVLKDGDIIDLHQTVNGESMFLVLTVSPLDIRYFNNPERLYEYSKEGMLEPCRFRGETEWEIIDNMSKHPNLSFLHLNTKPPITVVVGDTHLAKDIVKDKQIPEIKWVSSENRPVYGQVIIFNCAYGLCKGTFYNMGSGKVFVEDKKDDVVEWHDVFEWIPYPKDAS